MNKTHPFVDFNPFTRLPPIYSNYKKKNILRKLNILFFPFQKEPKRSTVEILFIIESRAEHFMSGNIPAEKRNDGREVASSSRNMRFPRRVCPWIRYRGLKEVRGRKPGGGYNGRREGISHKPANLATSSYAKKSLVPVQREGGTLLDSEHSPSY